MSQQRVERAKEVLDQVMDLPEAQRDAFLRRACGEDHELYDEVASLLDFEDDDPRWPEQPLMPSLMEAPAAGAHRGFPAGAADWDPSPGDCFGRYRVETSLGRGGMGAVALAVREDDFEKRVALKVLTAISPSLVRRFEQERQMLARLEHPNVARLLDGGTADDGRPWFAMEYVDGQPIDQFCDQRGLDVRERIELVLQVCSGLEVAHRNLVVHRDIKPTNILVPVDGLPKILDFGIAKSLAPADVTELTHITERPMTPRWAAPEQINAELVTTATDVYGMGLLLYRLLTGHHAFEDEKSEMELIAAIRERAPQRPSARADAKERRKLLAGDLDAIIGKALRKDPAKRYASISELVADLRAYLDGRPVDARQGTRWYFVRRFVARNWLPVSAATLILVFGVTFGLVANVLRIDAEEARDEAEVARIEERQARSRSEQVLTIVSELLYGVNPDTEKAEAVEILKAAEERLDAEDDPQLAAKILEVVGRTYAEWGETEEAVRAWERSLGILRDLYPRSEYPDGHPDLAAAINNLASGHFLRREYRPAVALYSEALEMKEAATESVPDLGKSYANKASALMRLGELGEVEELYQESLTLREAELIHGDPSTSTVAYLAERDRLERIGKSHRGLAAYYLEIGDAEASETSSRQALDYLLRSTDYKETTRIASIRTGLGRALHDQGRTQEALTQYTSAYETRFDSFGADHLHVASSHLDLARAMIDLERFEGAAANLRQADSWLGTQPPHRYGSYKARGIVLSGVLEFRRDGCDPRTEESLMIGFEQLTEGQTRLDHYGRRARGWLQEYADQCGTPESVKIEESPSIRG